MRKILTLAGVLLLLLSANAFAGNYKLDQSKIDAMMAQADEVVAVSAYELTDFYALPGNAAQQVDKDPVIAFIINLVAGPLGLHRLYLGTDIVTFIVYLVTGGGCGIIATVDAIMLLLVLLDQRDFQQFVDNPKIIMWADEFK